MTKKIAALTILTLAACPADDGTTLDTATGTDLESATGAGDGDSGPDLPPETTGDGDGDGDPGTTGDGDGEPGTGDGDGDPTAGDGDPTGDGDGDTGSEAVPYSLEVEADGERIGYLMGVWDFGYSVWDDVNEVTFLVNQQTGHVTGSGQPATYYYVTNDCTGQRYQIASSVAIDECGDVGLPVRRRVFGDGGSPGGHSSAMTLAMQSGLHQVTNFQSLGYPGQCSALPLQYCAYAIESTDVIPTTFPLPITVVESTLNP